MVLFGDSSSAVSLCDHSTLCPAVHLRDILRLIPTMLETKLTGFYLHII